MCYSIFMSMTQLKFLTDKYKNKIEIVEDFLASNVNISISDFIKRTYDKQKSILFLDLVKDSLSVDETNYLRSKLGKSGHLRDQRSCEEYALDLVLGWIMEDAILKILDKLGFPCSLASEDRNREFLKSPKATPDYDILSSNNKKFKLELVNDFTGFWKKKKKIHLRDNKYNKLKEDDGILLGIDFINKEFFVLKIKKTKATFVPRHFLYGGKPAWEFGLENQPFFSLDQMKKILEDFLK